jgi:hypothetical protein
MGGVADQLGDAAMDKRATILEHVAQSETYIEQGAERVERQTRLVAELERAGRDTTGARGLLANFEQWHAMHITEQARLQKLLAAL